MADEQEKIEQEKLDYAFSWLSAENGNGIFEAVKAQMQAANPILGAIEFEFYDCTKGNMPQKYQSAWTAAEGLTGASYKPLMTVGKQQAKGTNYWFIAEQTMATRTPETHIVTLAINEFGGNYTPVNGSIVRIF